jgi:hypothetical protein
MTFYDVAEFAAIRLARLASKETEESPLSEEMWAVAGDMHQRHGLDGLTGLVIALARQYATASAVVARHRGISTDDFFDEFEQHKLEHAVGDEEERPSVEVVRRQVSVQFCTSGVVRTVDEAVIGGVPDDAGAVAAAVQAQGAGDLPHQHHGPPHAAAPPPPARLQDGQPVAGFGPLRSQPVRARPVGAAGAQPGR